MGSARKLWGPHRAASQRTRTKRVCQHPVLIERRSAHHGKLPALLLSTLISLASGVRIVPAPSPYPWTCTVVPAVACGLVPANAHLHCPTEAGAVRNLGPAHKVLRP